jgi:hypothetical protein
MSAEIILPACHHFNAEPALQAPKTSSAFQPCATVMRLTSPQTGESPVPLQNSYNHTNQNVAPPALPRSDTPTFR